MFKALAHEMRRHVLLNLHIRGGMGAGEIARRYSCSWPTVSRHLKVLQDAGLVEAEREGREVHYRIRRTALDESLGGWLELFRDS